MRELDTSDDLSDSLRAWWPLDEAGGQRFRDISGYANHGRGTNGVGAGVGRWDKVATFDGVDDYILVPAKSPVNVTREVSISVWINPAGWGESNFGRIIDKDNGGNGWAIYLDNFFVSSGLGWRFGGTTGSLANCITLNIWQHVVVTTADATNFTVFVNGILRGTGGGGAGIGTTTTALAIGNRASDTARTFNGRMSNLRLWGRALRWNEPQRLYADPWIGTRRRPPRVWYLPSGGGVTITVPTSDIAVAGAVPAISAGKSVAVPAANVAVAAQAPSVATGTSVQVPAADIAVTGQAPTIATGVNVGVPASEIVVAGVAPAITASSILTLAVPVSEIVLAAHAPEITASGGLRGHMRGRRRRLWREIIDDAPEAMLPVVTAAEALSGSDYVRDVVEDAISRYRIAEARGTIERQERVLRQVERAIAAAVQRAGEEDDDDAIAVVM